LSDANEEITRQIDLLNEQAREIELNNITLQEQNLVIEQDRKELMQSNALLDVAHEQSESLLLNILPAPIAHRLKSGERAIADKFDSVTVLFADIVGFTKLSARTTPFDLVQGLNTIFGKFDTIAHKYGLEKIKTIGDAYMIAGGLPEPSTDHAERVARFALEVQEVMQDEALLTSRGETVQIRIGIHTGEAVAGVIGTSKFTYDLWGDTVNTASRMESHGEAGRVHVSEECFNVLKHQFTFEERGEIEIKGKGGMRTWFLTGGTV
jgi:adenylate cyclase